MREVFAGSLSLVGGDSPPIYVLPTTATHSRLGDALEAIQGAEDSLTAQLATGDTLTLTFSAPPLQAGKARECFVVSRGVYTSAAVPVQHALGPETIYGPVAKFSRTPAAIRTS